MRFNDTNIHSAVNTFADAVQAIRSGNTYANIHTVAHPGGEIRGQIEPSDDDG